MLFATTRRRVLSGAVVLPALLFASNLRAQVWSDEFSAPYLDGPVRDLVVYEGVLVAAGDFGGAGALDLAYVARWDGARWQPMSVGFDGPVLDLLVQDGTLFAAGSFTWSGAKQVNHVARWNGMGWARMASGLPGAVAHLAVHEDRVVAVGPFSGAAGEPRFVAVWEDSVWREIPGWPAPHEPPQAAISGGSQLLVGGGRHAYSWDGTAWSGMGPAFYFDELLDLAIHEGSVIVAGGGYGGGIARWNGDAWVGMSRQGSVSRVVVLDGALYALGSFEQATTSLLDSGVFRWTGTGWEHVGNPIDDPLWALTSFEGRLTLGGAPVVRPFQVRRLVDGTWDPLESFLPGMQGLDGPINAMALFQGDLVAGGEFSIAGGVPSRNIARWDGTAWHALGSGVNGTVWALIEFGDRLIVAGRFREAGGDSVGCVAAWDGAEWEPVGTGVGSEYAWWNSAVYALALLGEDLVAAGHFTRAGAVDAASVARWDGAGWSAMGGGIEGPVKSLVVFQEQLHAGGWVNVGGYDNYPSWGLVRWEGTSWLPAGPFYSNLGPFGHAAGSVLSAAVRGGDLFVGGDFFRAGGPYADNVARNDGHQWRQGMPGLTGPHDLESLDCAPCDLAVVSALAVYHGDLVAGGFFETAQCCATPVNGIARWNGTVWSAMGEGLAGPGQSSRNIHELYNYPDIPLSSGTGRALAVDGDRLYVGGAFSRVNGIRSYYLASYYEHPIAVRLTAFTVTRESGRAVVSWSVAGDPEDGAGFHVYRGREADRVRLTPEPLRGRTAYRFEDAEPPAEGADYWLQETGRTGETAWHGPVPLGPEARPAVLRLAQNTPNPFERSTRIAFTLDTAGPVRLDILDIRGRCVAEPLDTVLPAGEHELTWDGTRGDGTALPAGVYLYRLETRSGSRTRKLILGR